MDWLPSIPTLQVLGRFCELARLPLRVQADSLDPNVLFYPIRQETRLSQVADAFIKCIHPATSIAAALFNFLPLSQNTPDMRGVELMSDYRLRELWNTVANFNEDPLLYCYYSVFKTERELIWDGFTEETLEEKLAWLEGEHIPFVSFRVEPM